MSTLATTLASFAPLFSLLRHFLEPRWFRGANNSARLTPEGSYRGPSRPFVGSDLVARETGNQKPAVVWKNGGLNGGRTDFCCTSCNNCCRICNWLSNYLFVHVSELLVEGFAALHPVAVRLRAQEMMGLQPSASKSASPAGASRSRLSPWRCARDCRRSASRPRYCLSPSTSRFFQTEAAPLLPPASAPLAPAPAPSFFDCAVLLFCHGNHEAFRIIGQRPPTSNAGGRGEHGMRPGRPGTPDRNREPPFNQRP